MSFRNFRLAIIFMLWSCVSFATHAQEPEQLPPPRLPAEPFVPPRQDSPAPLDLQSAPYPLYPEPPPRLDSRAGWAYFAPNQYGQMRPRVVFAPGQSYYLYTGAPYPYTTVNPRFFLPKTSFPASFGK